MPYFIGSQGRIFYHCWLPDGEVNGAVVLLHGYGEHLGLYATLARRLVADGHAVHAMDAVGHGRSEGQRALIASWDYYVDDARILAALVRQAHPDSPIILIGHSGGAEAAILLAQRSPEIAQAVVLSGAPIRPLDWVESVLTLGEPETEPGDPTEWMSTQPDYVHALLHDPLTWKGGFRRETLLGAYAALAEIGAGLDQGRPDVPVLFVHGESDPVVPVEVARRSAAQLPRAQIRTFPGDLHDVLNEHDRDQVHEVVAGFINEAVALQPVAG